MGAYLDLLLDVVGPKKLVGSCWPWGRCGGPAGERKAGALMLHCTFLAAYLSAGVMSHLPMEVAIGRWLITSIGR
jgi:hypothetical protein